MQSESKAPPTGQGLRIRVSIEETGNGRTAKFTSFLPFSSEFSEDIERRFKREVTTVGEVMQKTFEEDFAPDIKQIYYPKQTKEK